MLFASSILSLAALAATCLAQNIQFNSVPGPFTIGRPAVITWSGSSSSSSVTLTLRKGSPSNLDTIGIIASNLRGSNNYTWTPASDLTPANDYALQITQGLDDVNYSGQFSILASNASDATTIVAIGGGSTSVVATITANVTSTLAAGSSAGTGTAMVRNSTMSSATLRGTATLTSTSTTTTGSGTSRSTGATSTGAAAGFVAAQASQVVGYGAVALGAAVLLF